MKTKGIPALLRLTILILLMATVVVARTSSSPQTIYYNYGDYTRMPKGVQVIYDANGNPISTFYYDASFQSTSGYDPYYDRYYRNTQPTPSAFPDAQRANDMFKSYRTKKVDNRRY